MLEDSSRLFSEALEERSSELESLKTHVEAELEVRKTSENRLSQLQSGLELMKHERDEAQRARDVAMVQNREYVERMAYLQDQYETALADVKSSVREKLEMQRALDAVSIQNREHVEKLANIQDQYETGLANVESITREKEEMQRALDESSLVQERMKAETFDDGHQYVTALAEIESMKRTQACRETELVNIRKQHSEEVSGITHELEVRLDIVVKCCWQILHHTLTASQTYLCTRKHARK